MIKRLYDNIKGTILTFLKNLSQFVKCHGKAILMFYLIVALFVSLSFCIVGCRGLYGVAWNLNQNGNQVTVADTHDDSTDMSGANINITDTSDNV